MTSVPLRYVRREQPDETERNLTRPAQSGAGERQQALVDDGEPRLIPSPPAVAGEAFGPPSGGRPRRPIRRGAAGPFGWLIRQLRSSVAQDGRSPPPDRFANLRLRLGREIMGEALLAPAAAPVSSSPTFAADRIAPSRFAPDIESAPRAASEPRHVGGDGPSPHPLSRLRRS